MYLIIGIISCAITYSDEYSFYTIRDMLNCIVLCLFWPIVFLGLIAIWFIFYRIGIKTRKNNERT